MNPDGAEKCARDMYWEELSDSEKILKLGRIIEALSSAVIELEHQLRDLNHHEHGASGKVMSPIKPYDLRPSRRGPGPLNRRPR